MSAQDKDRVKAAVARFVGDARNTRVNPGDLAALVEAEIGIAFGATTIARYLAAHGWARDGDGSPVVYSRPPTAKKTRAPAAADAPIPDSDSPAPEAGESDQAASDRTRGTILTGTGDMTMDMPTHVPLNKLLLSPRNVRKRNGDVEIEELAASIAEKGRLLQNLVVSAAVNGRGIYEVDAGGRRWRALQLLVKQGRLPRDWLVPVIVVPREDAAESSLAENQRVPMNPADEVIAFREVTNSYAAKGVSDPDARVAMCARRFGQEERYIVERLRLADLAPEILDALGEGRISLDVAKAYAAYPDQGLQLKVFQRQDAINGGRHSVASIRAELAGKVYRRGDRQVRFVTIEAYQAAGGRLELELFMGSEDEEVLIDTALLDRLCREKAEAAAQEKADEVGLAGFALSGWGAQAGFPKAPAGYETAPGLNILSQDRKTAIGVYQINEAGDDLTLMTTAYFRPKIDVDRSRSAPPVESEIDRLARIRREKIQLRAIRLSTPAFAGTPFEGRVRWPVDHAQTVPTIQDDGDDHLYVALLVQVSKSDVEAAMAQAERLYDQEEFARDTEPATEPASAEPEPVA
jgi:ParB family chromosome partitioning protein